jgi:hypothetical protein
MTTPTLPVPADVPREARRDRPNPHSPYDVAPDASGPAAASVLPDGRSRPLTRGEATAARFTGAALLVLGLVGFVNSFAAVQAAAAGSFGRLAWTIPLGIDVGIAVFSALDIVLARLDLRIAWLRLVPWTLTAATVYLNIAHARDAFGVIAHAAGPALWVLAVEVVAHTARVRSGLTSGRRMDTIRASRWLLAPLATARLWRRMVLWEIRSYPTALDREKSRLLALTDLQDGYGRLTWRWRAPRRARALYRLGELTPTTPATAPGSDSGSGDGGDGTGSAGSSGSADRATGATGATGARRGRSGGKGGRGAGTAKAVARLRKQHPTWTTQQIAERVEVSDRQVRRILADLDRAADGAGKAGARTTGREGVAA